MKTISCQHGLKSEATTRIKQFASRESPNIRTSRQSWHVLDLFCRRSVLLNLRRQMGLLGKISGRKECWKRRSEARKGGTEGQREG